MSARPRGFPKPDPAYARSPANARLESFLAGSAVVLLVAFIFFEVIGFGAFYRDYEAGEAAQGNQIRQLVLMGLFAWSLVLTVARPQAAMRLLAASWPILLVISVMMLSLLWSQFPDLTIRRALVFWIYLGIGIGTSIWIRPASRYIGVWAVACAVAIVADLGSAVAMPRIAWTELGLAGLHYHKNSAGMFAFVALVFIAAGGLVTRSALAKLAAVVAFLMGIVFLVLTQSKNSIGFSVITALVVLPTLALGRSGRHRTSLVLASLGALLALVLVFTGAQGWTFSEFVGNASGDSTFTGRTELWVAALSYIGENLLLGRGFGAHWSVPPEAHPLLDRHGWWSSNYSELITYNESHNGYLDIAVQLGVLGSAVVLLFLVMMAFTVWRIFHLKDRTGADTVPIYAAACLMIGILLLNLLESTLFFPASPLGAVFFLVAIYLTGWRLQLEEEVGAQALSAKRPKSSRGPWIGR